VNALLVGLDMTDLTAVGTLALSACAFAAAAGAAVGWGIGGCSGYSFLFLARESSLFVSVETAEFGFESILNCEYSFVFFFSCMGLRGLDQG
jgi:hypothetical protein